ncbi:MAG: AAA family ATPase [Aureispira sp.]|nr:AAA family ATPase [Aureispira sp.]
MNIIIFGPPLAGKGTQSKKIIKDFGLTHLSTGDALRSEKAQNSDLGIEAAEYSSKGLLVPDELVAKVVEKFYHNHKEEKGILFDGYPRNIDQAQHLLDLFEADNTPLSQIIFLKVPREELLKRAKKRAEEQNRKDDRDPKIVLTRIDEFERLTIPAVQHIKATGVKTTEIDGNQSIESIYIKIQEVLG